MTNSTITLKNMILYSESSSRFKNTEPVVWMEKGRNRLQSHIAKMSFVSQYQAVAEHIAPSALPIDDVAAHSHGIILARMSLRPFGASAAAGL
jgi:hypothetical protein